MNNKWFCVYFYHKDVQLFYLIHTDLLGSGVCQMMLLMEELTMKKTTKLQQPERMFPIYYWTYSSHSARCHWKCSQTMAHTSQMPVWSMYDMLFENIFFILLFVSLSSFCPFFGAFLCFFFFFFCCLSRYWVEHFMVIMSVIIETMLGLPSMLLNVMINNHINRTIKEVCMLKLKEFWRNYGFHD